MNIDFEREVIDRLARIETKQDAVKDHGARIDSLEKWRDRAIAIGALLLAAPAAAWAGFQHFIGRA